MHATDERLLLPEWVPVLRRGTDELQVGLEPGPGVVLAGVPAGTGEVLRLLDGTRSNRDIRRLAADLGVNPTLMDEVLHRLRSAGLLLSASTDQPVRPGSVDLSGRRVRLVGAGALGLAVAAAALDAGLDRLDIVDPDPVDPSVHPRPGLAGSQAEALRSRLAARARGRVALRVANHWTKPDDAAPDLTVIAATCAEPDRVIGEDYVRADHPHLYVRPLPGGVVVGPLVVPGRTPCLGCGDLLRRDADPAWPTLLPQLYRTRIPVAAPLADWAGLTAVFQVAGRLAGFEVGTGSGTLELTADLQVRYRRWPMHPACGCAWNA